MILVIDDVIATFDFDDGVECQLVFDCLILHDRASCCVKFVQHYQMLRTSRKMSVENLLLYFIFSFP